MTSLKLVMPLLLAVATGACSTHAPATSTAPSTAPLAVVPAGPPASAPAVRSADRTRETAMLAAYERARALLAADEIAGVAAAAREIEATATAAAADGSAAGPHLKGIASNATTLAGATELTIARQAFGEISRHLIALLAEDTALAQGKHVFECPMTKGYKKWVQTTENLENPYMGPRMLTCGGESSWE